MAETLGFIGLGNMGEPIAANLLAAGLRAARLQPHGFEGRATGGQGSGGRRARRGRRRGGRHRAQHDGRRSRTRRGLSRVPDRLSKGSVAAEFIFRSSTISPATARSLAEHHAKHGVAYVGSPVFGRPDAAAAKRLWVCVSGLGGAREKGRSRFFAAIGQGIFDYGDDPGAANVVKLCGNFMIAATIESIAELLTLAENNGLGKKAWPRMISTTTSACTRATRI